jgi:hypothetical protein
LLDKFFLLAFILCFSACTVNSRLEHNDDPAVVKVEIPEEKYDGQTLAIVANITTAYQLPIDKMGIRLRALDKSSIIAEEFFNLGTLLSRNNIENGSIKKVNTTEVNATISVPLMISAPKLSTYQLEVIWGNDVINLTDKNINVEILDIVLQNETPLIKTLVTNNGVSLCQNLRLRIKEKLSNEIGNDLRKSLTPNNEFRFPNLGLFPGHSREVILRFPAGLSAFSILDAEVISTDSVEPILEVLGCDT